MTYEIAMKRAKYMGDTNGAYRAGYGYDQPEMKNSNTLKSLTTPLSPYVQRERNWLMVRLGHNSLTVEPCSSLLYVQCIKMKLLY